MKVLFFNSHNVLFPFKQSKRNYFSRMSISPIDVVISHFPPSEDSGTLTEPMDVCVIKDLPVRSVPFTSPVDVLTVISPASQFSKRTSPVVLLMSKLPAATVSVSRTSPSFRM